MENEMSVTDRVYPKNDETTLHIRDNGGSFTIEEILDLAREHFKIEDVNKLTITMAEIQECCFGYDLYDPVDYGNYFIIQKETA
jgi:hypothetical protein